MKHIFLIYCIISSGLIFGQNISWTKSLFGSYNNIKSSKIKNNNIYSIGDFQTTVDFDPGTNNYQLTSSGMFDIFIQKLDSAGNFKWAISFGNQYYDQSHGITLDKNENIYSIGTFSSTVDFDSGLNTFTLTSGNGGDPPDLFITKHDSSGNFLWAKKIEGSANAGVAYCIASDSLNNIYISGLFVGTIDFDPGPSIFNLFGSNGDSFLLKLDSNGNFQWVKQIIGNSNIFNLEIDNNQNIYTSGDLRGVTDFDPGLGTYTLSSTTPGTPQGYLSKLDGNGNFIWAKSMTGNGNSPVVCVKSTSNNNLFIGGAFNLNLNADSFNLTAIYNDVYIIKADASNGEFLWVKQIGGSGNDLLYSIETDSVENVYITGEYSNSVDFDPNAGSNILTSKGASDVFLEKINNNGDLLWVKSFGSADYENARTVLVDNSLNVYSTGVFNNTIDFDNDTTHTLSVPTSSTTSYNSFFVKIKQDICSNTNATLDSIFQMSCTAPYSTIFASVINGSPPYSYNWSSQPSIHTSSISVSVPGLYEVQITDAYNCVKTTTALVNSLGHPLQYDLNSNLISLPFRRGFSSNIWVDAFNDGCTSVFGSLKVILDPMTTFNSSIPMPTNISGDTLMWALNTFNCDSLHFIPNISVTTSLLTSIGDTVCIQSIITPISGDADQSNNIKNYCFPVLNGYDPNDKQVYPKGKCPQGYILNNQLLTYTVRFQNTGNASAININVLDSLDINLDLNSLRVISSSHNMFTEVLPNRVLNFHFNNINLPDSTSNETGSHGYVIFEVMPLTNLANGTIIENKADIYFDYNSPIVTNKVLNTVVNSIPTDCNSIIGIREYKNEDIQILPNPNTGKFAVVLNTIQAHIELEIINMIGQSIKKITESNTNKIDLELECASGIYFAKINISGEQHIFKILKQ